jgi:hypothetical protein
MSPSGREPLGDIPMPAIPQTAGRLDIRINLTSGQWLAFVEALYAPAKRHPRMERLFKEPTILDLPDVEARKILEAR